MSSSDRRAWVTLALIALASCTAVTPAYARGEEHEHRAPEGERHAPRQNHRAEAPRAANVRAAPARQPYRAPEHPVAAHAQLAAHAQPAAHPQLAAHSQVAAHPQVATHPQVAVNNTVHPHAAYAPAGPARVVHYGGPLSGTVERSIRPGFVSRTFVSGGRVMYTHVYQQHVWNQFGRAFPYETYVPAIRFPAAYYGWALAPWAHPVVYSWGWRGQPWYPTYGVLFTPYPVYASPDLWMTDYILAQNMQAAYQAQVAYQSQAAYPVPGAPPAPESPPAASTYVDPAAAPGATDADSGYVDPAAAPGAVAPDPAAPAPASSPAQQTSDRPSAPPTPPPAITPQIKAQLDEQIKVQLQEQQAAAATPATLTADSSPPALRPNHVFFQVVQPLDVPSGANRHCTLSVNDYIKRTGGMSNDDWQIPVVVELSGPSDCPEGLHTRIGLNDLNAMENEQEAQVLEAMRAASKGMGPNGPPSGPAQPSLIADGSATPDPDALQAFRQAQ